jgi:hypothetical protein
MRPDSRVEYSNATAGRPARASGLSGPPELSGPSGLSGLSELFGLSELSELSELSGLFGLL